MRTVLMLFLLPALIACGRDPTSPPPLRGLCAEGDVCDPSPYIVPAPQPNSPCVLVQSFTFEGVTYTFRAYYSICPIP